MYIAIVLARHAAAQARDLLHVGLVFAAEAYFCHRERRARPAIYNSAQGPATLTTG